MSKATDISLQLTLMASSLYRYLKQTIGMGIQARNARTLTKSI